MCYRLLPYEFALSNNNVNPKKKKRSCKEVKLKRKKKKHQVETEKNDKNWIEPKMCCGFLRSLTLRPLHSLQHVHCCSIIDESALNSISVELFSRATEFSVYRAKTYFSMEFSLEHDEWMLERQALLDTKHYVWNPNARRSRWCEEQLNNIVRLSAKRYTNQEWCEWWISPCEFPSTHKWVD